MGSHQQWLIGMCYVVAVALIWIAASFIVQDIEGEGVPPLLLTYICNSLFVLYLPVFFIGRTIARFQEDSGSASEKWRRLCGTCFGRERQRNGGLTESVQKEDAAMGREHGHSEKSLLLSTGSQPHESEAGDSSDGGAWSGTAPDRAKQTVPGSAVDTAPVSKFSSWESAKAGLWASPFWFAAQFTFNLSLSYTSVTSNTILSSMSSLFTFLISVKFLNERFTWPKLVSVILCMVGTAIVSLADSSNSGPDNTLFGDFLCLLSAVCYSTYTALIRWKLPDEEDNGSTMQFFGFLGVFNAALFAPAVLIAHLTGLQRIHILPRQLSIVVAKGMFDNVLSDYLWARAVLLTSPTAATAGLSIQIPVAILIDIIFKGRFPTPLLLFGGVVVLVGFLGINAPVTGCCKDNIEDDERELPFDAPRTSPTESLVSSTARGGIGKRSEGMQDSLVAESGGARESFEL